MVMKVNLGTMELEILGMNFGCVLSALSDAKIPEKECLLPLVSKLLGYCIVAASTTVKLPQGMEVCHIIIAHEKYKPPCSEAFAVLTSQALLLGSRNSLPNMISGFPVVCSVTTISALQSWPVHGKPCPTTSAAPVLKLSRKPSSLMACCVRKPSTGTCSLPGFQSSETLDMNNGSRSASGTTVKILSMDIGYILSASLHTKIPSMDSLLSLLSKVLGYFIIATSTVAKLPQILKILKHGSVRGLSVASFELELIGYTIALAYCIHKGLPFSAYGELAFLLIQAIILIAIIYYYSPPMGSKTWMKALVYCGLAPTVLAGKIDPGLFEILYASQHAIFFCARVPQIWKNFANKSTGELSFLTCFMNFAGSLVRVFTSIQEKTPLSVLMGSAIGIATNGTILSQIMIYQKPVPKKEKKED